MTLVDGPGPGASPVTVWTLAMRSPERLRPARDPDQPALLVRSDRPDPELSAWFYRQVGGPWLWVDRLTWTDDQWLAWVDRPEHQLVSCWCPPSTEPGPAGPRGARTVIAEPIGRPGAGTAARSAPITGSVAAGAPPPGRAPGVGWVPAGYFELEQQGPSVEVVYFGLMEGFIGRGLGGWLLTGALRRAWAVPGTERVWLHTCSLDGPHALANYRARGLEVTAESVEWRLV